MIALRNNQDSIVAAATGGGVDSIVAAATDAVLAEAQNTEAAEPLEEDET